MKDILSLVGLIITFILAIVNLVTTFQLEKVKRNYDFLKFKFDKLFEIKEKIHSIKNEASDTEIRRSSAEGDSKKLLELSFKYLSTYMSLANSILAQLLKYSHLFTEQNVKLIWDKCHEIENLENMIIDSVNVENRDERVMIELMEKKLKIYRNTSEWGIEFIEKELRELVKKMEIGAKQKKL